MWRGLLDAPAHAAELGLAFDDFDDAAEPIPVTATNLPSAILLGCTRRLLSGREAAFQALRRGFVRCEDLQVQLGALGSADELSLLITGKQRLSAAELIDCFAMPSSSVEAQIEAGFAAVGSNVPQLFAMLLHDEATFDEPRRFAMLRWCTALAALPVGGLKQEPIKLKLYGPEPDDETLPETHTCTREVCARPRACGTALCGRADVEADRHSRCRNCAQLHLPNYSSVDVLRQKLLKALEHADDGFGKA
jgi:hypothetical protein